MSTGATALLLETARGPVNASVTVPGSKSISNRALVCAALASGESTISHLASGNDTARMLDCMMTLGVNLERSGSSLSLVGLNGRIRGGGTLDAGLAGTTSRFMTAVAALAEKATTITGEVPLRRRPIQELLDALRSLGAEIDSMEEPDHLPIRVKRSELRGGTVRIRGDVSSQFITSLMLIGPYLEGGLEIVLTSPLVSQPYVRMTADVMSTFGIDRIEFDTSRVMVPEGRYVGCSFTVEPDASSASYPLASAAIAGGRVAVERLTRQSMQGDIAILDILGEMGCSLEETSDSCATIRSGDLVGIDIDMSDVSDLVPTVAATALYCSTPSRIRNIGFIRQKESDRIGDLVMGIETIGGRAIEHVDGLEIFPMGESRRDSVVPSTCHDHRLALAWSLIALRRPGVVIDDPQVVDKSWPEWWQVREVIRASGIQ